MIVMHKNTRFLAISMLLIGFLLSNPVSGICVSMLSEYFTDFHSEMTSGCCDSENEMPYQSHDNGLRVDTHGCDCCGCGLQSDDSSAPSEQPSHAVVQTQVNEVLTSWKTISTQSVAEILPETAFWDDYPSSHCSNAIVSDTDAFSPPLFILNQVLLN